MTPGVLLMAPKYCWASVDVHVSVCVCTCVMCVHVSMCVHMCDVCACEYVCVVCVCACEYVCVCACEYMCDVCVMCVHVCDVWDSNQHSAMNTRVTTTKVKPFWYANVMRSNSLLFPRPYLGRPLCRHRLPGMPHSPEGLPRCSGLLALCSVSVCVCMCTSYGNVKNFNIQCTLSPQN